MKILVIVGSKQFSGNTDILADNFIEGAKPDNEIVKFHLRKYMVSPCLGCNMCFKDGKPCIQNDDMNEIYPEFEKCDMIVMATPLYFSTFSSSMKCFIDRLYALSDHTINGIPKKDSILLVTANDNNPDTFKFIDEYYRQIFIKNFKWRNKGIIFAGGCGGTNTPRSIHSTKYLEEAKRLGSRIK